VASQSDIERLIDMGLNRYGSGDIDGALLVWEQALAIDPDNAQANSYVEYVRLNYDILTSSEPELVHEPGYALEEEPEYQIEIELPPAQEAPVMMDPTDNEWFIEEETRDASAPRVETRTRSKRNSASDDEMTREFRPDFAGEASTGEFQPESTPIDFGQQETEIRKRDFGFVQPVEPVKNEKGSSPISIGTASTVELASSGAALEKPKRTTQDLLPMPPRTPARRDSESLSHAEVMLPHAPTQDFELSRAMDPAAPTRELGLRGEKRASTNSDDAVTKESDVRAIREAAAKKGNAEPVESTRHDIVLAFDPIDARTREILEEVDEDAPANEPKEEQTRRRITALLQKAVAFSESQETEKAVAAVDLALSEDPNSALGQKLIARNKDTIMQVFQTFIGDLERMPQLAKPLQELQNAPINPRAAFLLSRIDGSLTIDELLDVSGMPRLEAYRHICQLFLRGILR
jgi:tetratricopeptide (TPR) repeat protein